MYKILWNRYRGQSAFKTYCGFYRKYKWSLFRSMIIYWIKSSPIYIIPILTADIINAITEPGDHSAAIIIRLTIIGLIIIIQNIPTHYWCVVIFSNVSRQVEQNLRSALCARLQHLSMHFHTSNKMGVLQTKVLRDVENIETLTRTFFDTLPLLFASVIVAIVVTLIRAPLFSLFYITVVPSAVILFRIIRKQMADRNRDFRVSIESMNGRIGEMLRLMPVTRAHHLEDQELDRVNSSFDSIRQAGYRLDKINAIFGAVNWVLVMIFNLVTLTTAAILYHFHVLTIGVGDIVLLTGYFNTISGSVMTLLNILPGITKGMESVKSIGDVLECPDLEQNDGKAVVESLKGSFKFEHTGFTYGEDGGFALHDFNLDVKPGENIALVGASGAGKSTITQLVIGFIRPTEGRILLDGRDMNELDLRTYRRFISVVTQETILFDGSIRDNIAYGMPQATDEQIMAAIRYANLEELIKSMPEGLKTQIHENGSRLSGGQRQRIAIARALLRDPRVLILDEATSALDVDSEAEIKASLDILVKGRTTFVVAHRLSTIQKADRIVVMADGRIVEIGNHEELLAKNGRYAAMYHKFVNQK